MREKLTPKFIDGLKPATAKRYEVRDVLLVGLLIRVSRRGAIQSKSAVNRWNCVQLLSRVQYCDTPNDTQK